MGRFTTIEPILIVGVVVGEDRLILCGGPFIGHRNSC